MLVAFDLDNTLVDRAGAVDRWAWEFVAAHDLDEALRPWLIALDADGYANRHEVFATIAGRFGLGDADALLGAYRERVVELITLTSGAAECLVRLRADGHGLVIVTNGSSTQQDAKIDRLGLRALVDAVVVSGTVGVSKPDPRFFELAATAAESSLDGAWMVGDSPVNDIAGAQRLGLRTVWMARGRSWNADLPPGPHYRRPTHRRRLHLRSLRPGRAGRRRAESVESERLLHSVAQLSQQRSAADPVGVSQARDFRPHADGVACPTDRRCC